MNPEFPIDPREELEAKLTSLLLGELTAEEAATLRQAMAQDAELAKVYEQLQLTVELVREVATQPTEQTAVQAAPLKLGEQRRAGAAPAFQNCRAEGICPTEAPRGVVVGSHGRRSGFGGDYRPGSPLGWQ